jgi:hypothetical protein
MRFDVQIMDVPGHWLTVTNQYEERPMRPRGSTRRAATYELQARGLHYFLVKDEDFGADDYKDDPDAWGLQVVARASTATLYRVAHQ